MKLETQVVSLEPSKKLKELGVKQESYYRWSLWEKKDIRVMSGYPRPAEPIEIICSAFTVAELGEMLRLGGQVWMPYFCDQAMDNGWVYKFQTGKIIVENTEADARAKMLIYLLESSLIVNK